VSFELLIVITTLQLAVLLLLLVGMLMARIARMVLTPVYDREVAQASALVRQWMSGDIDDELVKTQMIGFSDDVFSAVVRGYSSVVEGGRWEDFVTLLRGTPWFGGVKRRVRSLLWWRRLDSARALALLAREQEAGLVQTLLADKHHAVRLAAVRILKRVPDVELLREVFDEATRAAPVLQGYLFDILQTHDRVVADVVLERLRCIDDGRALASAVQYVEQVADPIYLDAVLELVHHPIADVRAAAVHAVARFPHRRSSAALLSRSEDNSPVVREAVCSALGDMSAVEAADALTVRLGDASWRVRLAACVALRRLGVAGAGALRSGKVGVHRDEQLVQYVLSLAPEAVLEHSLPVEGL